ncbi:spore germination protein [Oceanobacillus sp. M65]|uniref:spore germination protein n=1 Tax=Oceanobacillus TaxID=182709 RepID=UPI0013735F45|nr:spore gernimation protein GerA [Halomonas sp. MG34]
MSSLLSEIEATFKDNDDFFLLPQNIQGIDIVLMGLTSLIDISKSIEALEEKLVEKNLTKKEILMQLNNSGEKKTNIEEISSSVIEGKLLVLVKSKATVITLKPIGKKLSRSVESSENEQVLQGPLVAFTEELDTSIGILRKQLPTANLLVKNYTMGRDINRKLSLLYCKGKASQKLIRAIMDKIETSQDKEINNIQDLIKVLGMRSHSVVAPFKITELPEEAAQSLLKGKVALFLDNFPFALVLPGVIWDLFILENDRNFTYPLMLAIRLLRIVAIIVSLIVPGLYVALVAVNPEVLRIELALSIAQSREGIPYPAFVEMLFMLIIMEFIIEGSIRLPKSIGPTITMVGGIIIGQAVVEAKLVSNILIIFLAAATIANSTIIGFQNAASIRLFKYIILILAAIYGVLGVLAGIFLIGAHLASIQVFGISYLSNNLKKEGAKIG